MGAQNWTHLLPRASPWPWGCLPGGPSWGKQNMSKDLLVLNSLPHFQSLESGAIPANALEHWPPMVPFDSGPTGPRVAVSVYSSTKPGRWGQAMPRPPAWHEYAGCPSLGPGETK